MNDIKTFFDLLDQKHQVIMDMAYDIQTIIHMFSADERIEFVNTIMSGYCKYCGREGCNGVCENDE